MSEENKTKFRLEIDKTIQPKQYEPIKIIVDIEETFCWTDKKDRDIKIREYTEKIAGDFVNIFDYAVKKIGEESRCIGNVVTSEDILESGKKNISEDDGEFTFD